jgi:hypothetical protein
MVIVRTSDSKSDPDNHWNTKVKPGVPQMPLPLRVLTIVVLHFYWSIGFQNRLLKVAAPIPLAICGCPSSAGRDGDRQWVKLRTQG